MATSPSDRARIKTLRDNYNLTPEMWEAINTFQHGLCFICNKTQKSGKRLATDHCHNTGLVRGLLCSSCNVLLGKIENAYRRGGYVVNVLDLLKNLIIFLQKPPAVEALGAPIFGYPGRCGTGVQRKYLKRQSKANQEATKS